MTFERLFAPLYLASLGGIRVRPSAAVLTPVSALFFLTQFLLIVEDFQAGHKIFHSTKVPSFRVAALIYR